MKALRSSQKIVRHLHRILFHGPEPIHNSSNMSKRSRQRKRGAFTGSKWVDKYWKLLKTTSGRISDWFRVRRRRTKNHILSLCENGSNRAYNLRDLGRHTRPKHLEIGSLLFFNRFVYTRRAQDTIHFARLVEKFIHIKSHRTIRQSEETNKVAKVPFPNPPLTPSSCETSTKLGKRQHEKKGVKIDAKTPR